MQKRHISCILGLLLSTAAPAQNQGWPIYGGTGGDHYSPLKQINRKNAASLKQAWRFDTGDAGILENTPLIVGHLLYAVTYSEKVIALDGATGRQVWRFDPGIKGTQPVRGASYWKDGDEGRILVGIMNFLYELDAETGKPVETFGNHGHVDLREGLDIDPSKASVVMTTPGAVYKDTIILGFRAPETHPAPHGDLRAFDLHTGKLRWSFHTIPHPGEPGYETWPPDAWKTAGAANAWSGITLDTPRGIVYAATGSAVDDFYGGDRTGNDLFANTLLALDANTGKQIWHFQGVHHDIWDRDFPSAPVLGTITRAGKRIDAVAQATKQGFLYVFDRVTGIPLFPIEEVAVPQSDVPGEHSSPTQPHPLAPAPFTRQALTEADLTNRTPEAHAAALAEFRSMKVGPQFTPFDVDRQTLVVPGFDGGAEWGGQAIDRKTGVFYVNANNIATSGALTDNSKQHGAGMTIYLTQCAVCHGTSRAGSPPEFPSLLGVTDRLTSAQIAALIHGGKGRMPSFPNVEGDLLTAVETYLKTGKDSGPPMRGAAPNPNAPQPGTAAAASANPHGASLYAAHCAICHGEKAVGIQPGFPSLRGVAQRQTEPQLVAVIRSGRGRMPAFTKLSATDVSDLTRYLGAAPLTPEKKELEAATEAPSPYRFTGYKWFRDPEGYPAMAPPWGTLSAIDLNTGKYLWQIPFGEYPELAAKGMTNTGTESYGGPIVTEGGVLFIAATIFDRKFHVFDSSTGKLLWQTELPFGGLATPTTYMIDGKQYVVIAAGGGKDPKHALGGSYIAFALP